MASKRSPGLPIPSDWNGSDWTRFSICWPNSLEWRAILAGFLTTPMMGRTWDGATGTITAVQQIGREIFESNLDWRYCIMSACDENGLDRLIEAIGNIQAVMAGCCGGGHAGITVGGGPGPLIDPPLSTETGGTVPPGFPETWDYQDYQVYRCRAANKIIDDLALTVYNLTGLGGLLAGIATGALYLFINTSLLSGLVVGVMAIGFSAVTAASIVIASIVAMIAIGSSQFAYFETLATAIRDDKQNLICQLFNASSVEEARALTEASIDGYIEGLIGIDEAASDAVNKLVKALLGNAVYNLLVEFDPAVNAYVGDLDCTECVEDWYTVYDANGNPRLAGAFDFEAESRNNGGYYGVSVYYDDPSHGASSVGLVTSLSITSGSYNPVGDGTSYDPVTGTYQTQVTNLSDLYGVELQSFGFASSTPFTVRVVHEEIV